MFKDTILSCTILSDVENVDNSFGVNKVIDSFNKIFHYL